jgi:hypothetical protein
MITENAHKSLVQEEYRRLGEHFVSTGVPCAFPSCQMTTGCHWKRSRDQAGEMTKGFQQRRVAIQNKWCAGGSMACSDAGQESLTEKYVKTHWSRIIKWFQTAYIKQALHLIENQDIYHM